MSQPDSAMASVCIGEYIKRTILLVFIPRIMLSIFPDNPGLKRPWVMRELSSKYFWLVALTYR